MSFRAARWCLSLTGLLFVAAAASGQVFGQDSEKKDGLKATPADPLDGLRVATGIADLSENFDDYRFRRRRP